MPHVPRRYPTTTGLPPESLPQQGREHAPTPVRRDEVEQKPARLSLGLGKINLKTYEPDFKAVFKTMFGTEPNIDPNTRQLVHAPKPAAAVTFGP